MLHQHFPHAGVNPVWKARVKAILSGEDNFVKGANRLELPSTIHHLMFSTADDQISLFRSRWITWWSVRVTISLSKGSSLSKQALWSMSFWEVSHHLHCLQNLKLHQSKEACSCMMWPSLAGAIWWFLTGLQSIQIIVLIWVTDDPVSYSRSLTNKSVWITTSNLSSNGTLWEALLMNFKNPAQKLFWFGHQVILTDWLLLEKTTWNWNFCSFKSFGVEEFIFDSIIVFNKLLIFVFLLLWVLLIALWRSALNLFLDPAVQRQIPPICPKSLSTDGMIFKRPKHWNKSFVLLVQKQPIWAPQSQWRHLVPAPSFPVCCPGWNHHLVANNDNSGA